MKINQLLWCRSWSILLHVFTSIISHRSKVSGERVQGCVESKLNLSCEWMKIIEITTVVLGDSTCRGTSCCIKDGDCTHIPNANHANEVRLRCNGRSNCTVYVIKEEIPCGYFYDRKSNNDFERITYECRDATQRLAVTTDATTLRTDDSLKRTNQSSSNETAEDKPTTLRNEKQNKETDRELMEKKEEGSSMIIYVVMVTSGIIFFIIVIVIVVVKLRRIMQLQRKHSPQLCYIELERNASHEENETETRYNGCPSPSLTFSGETSPEMTTCQGNRMARNCDSACYDEANNVIYSMITKDNDDIMPSNDDYCTACIMLDNTFYSEFGQPEKVSSSQRSHSEEALRHNECNAMKKNTNAQKPTLEAHSPIKLKRTLETVKTSAMKTEFPAESPIYESLTPRTPESKLFLWPMATTKNILKEDSEMEHPYCDMQWPQLKFQQDDEFENSAQTDSYMGDDDNCHVVKTRKPVETGSHKGDRKTEISEDDETYDIESCKDLVWFTNGEGDDVIDNAIYNH